jgi:hypothetical protein
MSLSANQINEAIDIALDQLKFYKLKSNVRKNEIAIWTHGELGKYGGQSAKYAVAVIISAERNLTDDFHENFNAWLNSKGISTRRKY